MLTTTQKIGDKEFTFGELTFKQIDGFFGGGKKAVLSEVMLASLNNAKPAEPWTFEKLREELEGPASIRALQDAIMKFSEIELNKSAGEAAAAS